MVRIVDMKLSYDYQNKNKMNRLMIDRAAIPCLQ